MSDYKNVEMALAAMDDDDCLNELRNVLEDDAYENDEFTNTAQSILQRYTDGFPLTSKQLSFVKMHLKMNSHLWF